MRTKRVNRASRRLSLWWLFGVTLALSAFLAAAGPASRPTAKAPTSRPAAATWPKDLFVPPAQVGKQKAAILLYTGGIRSYFEPCGCQADMLGGLGRLTSFIRGYEKKNLPLFLVDAGNLYFEKLKVSKAKRSQDELKAELVAGLFRKVGLRAVGVGPHDLTLGTAWAQKLAKRSGALTIASNLVFAQGPKAGKAPFATRGIIAWGGRKIGLLSLTATPPKAPQIPGEDSHSGAFPKDFWKYRNLKVTSPEAAAKREIAALRKAGAQVIVLLSTMGIEPTAQLLEKTPGVDLAIDGHDEAAIEPPRQAGTALLMSTPKEGQKIGVFAMYGDASRKGWAPLQTPAMLQAKLKAAQEQVKSLEEQAKQMAAQGPAFKPIAAVYTKQANALRRKDIPALQKQLKLPLQLPAKGIGYAHALAPLVKGLGEFPAVVDRVQRYQSEVKAANLAALKKIKPILTTKSGNAFVGVATCKMCHQEQYKFWQKTRHANAYATLVKKKKQFDLDCIGCHVVGWQKPGGLYDIQKPQRLANVQCENCHSYGKIHATKSPSKKTIRGKVAASVCTGCHQGSHDPKFNYVEKLKKILGKGHGEKRLKELLGKKNL